MKGRSRFNRGAPSARGRRRRGQRRRRSCRRDNDRRCTTVCDSTGLSGAQSDTRLMGLVARWSLPIGYPVAVFRLVARWSRSDMAPQGPPSETWLDGSCQAIRSEGAPPGRLGQEGIQITFDHCVRRVVHLGLRRSPEVLPVLSQLSDPSVGIPPARPREPCDSSRAYSKPRMGAASCQPPCRETSACPAMSQAGPSDPPAVSAFSRLICTNLDSQIVNS